MSDTMRDRMGKVVCDLIETDQNTAQALVALSMGKLHDHAKDQHG